MLNEIKDVNKCVLPCCKVCWAYIVMCVDYFVSFLCVVNAQVHYTITRKGKLWRYLPTYSLSKSLDFRYYDKT